MAPGGERLHRRPDRCPVIRRNRREAVPVRMSEREKGERFTTEQFQKLLRDSAAVVAEENSVHPGGAESLDVFRRQLRPEAGQPDEYRIPLPGRFIHRDFRSRRVEHVGQAWQQQPQCPGPAAGQRDGDLRGAVPQLFRRLTDSFRPFACVPPLAEGRAGKCPGGHPHRYSCFLRNVFDCHHRSRCP